MHVTFSGTIKKLNQNQGEIMKKTVVFVSLLMACTGVLADESTLCVAHKLDVTVETKGQDGKIEVFDSSLYPSPEYASYNPNSLPGERVFDEQEIAGIVFNKRAVFVTPTQHAYEINVSLFSVAPEEMERLLDEFAHEVVEKKVTKKKSTRSWISTFYVPYTQKGEFTKVYPNENSVKVTMSCVERVRAVK